MTDDFIDNKIANKSSNVSRNSLQKRSETVTNETEIIRHNRVTPKKDVSRKKKQNYWWSKINIIME